MRISAGTNTLLLALAGSLALLLAGCGENTTSPTQSITQSQATAISDVVAADADAEIDGATASGTGSPVLSFAAGPGGLGRQCQPAKSPPNPSNADGDAVPDSVRFDFTGCVISRPFHTDSFAGTVDIVDPTPTTSDFSVKRVFTDFLHQRMRLLSGNTTAELTNGTRVAVRNSSTIQHTESGFRTDFTHADGSTSSHVRTWLSSFTADVAGSILPDDLLPSGTWNIAGNSTWTNGPDSFSLAVTTNPALHYDASCTEAPRFDSGTMTVVVTRAGTTATITIQFTACGAYTVTRS